MMINGKWSGEFDPIQWTDEQGGFVRVRSGFRSWITPDGSAGPTGDAGFPAEAGRYHLYVALICPWACRTLMARALKGLTGVVSVTVAEPRLTEQVWRFGNFPGSQPDPLYGYTYVHQLYRHADPQFTGQVTVPVLWDKKTGTIVNNESADIIRMFNQGFGDLASTDFDLYPDALRPEIDAWATRLYEPFNNGVYRCGFATTQEAYDAAVSDVFGTLEHLERRLAAHNFLVGNQITEADIRAFVTLVRFDAAYHGLFKANLRMIRDYPNLSGYLYRIHQLPGIAATVNLEHIRQGYYSLKKLNPSGIVPLGPPGPF